MTSDKCRHGKYVYDGCDECCAGCDSLRAALVKCRDALEGRTDCFDHAQSLDWCRACQTRETSTKRMEDALAAAEAALEVKP